MIESVDLFKKRQDEIEGKNPDLTRDDITAGMDTATLRGKVSKVFVCNFEMFWF